ncbi:hypothetical protein O6H91_03G040200 [Diphasiastrum complanatum]|uniref:Uncharacterized protein n=1 Tax=Diphasiastrum complanatum TaxID=34168 RepID=A0ACC2E5M9_DIPCM|nr:hypothetical protein O6H91_03G040200 [Diphasiastrum complanatum]
MAQGVSYMVASDLLRLRGSDGIAVVDVRDEERSFDGHIAGSLSYASDSFEEKIPNLLQDVKKKDIIVFHCAKSQIRGPTCARLFSDHLNRNTSVDKVGSVPRIYVLQRGFNGWAAAGHPVCYCGEQNCQKNVHT